MPDMTDFDRENSPNKPRRKLDVILDELEGTERHTALTTALHDRSYTSAAIGRVLRSWGYDITEDSVQSWRTSR